MYPQFNCTGGSTATEQVTILLQQEDITSDQVLDLPAAE